MLKHPAQARIATNITTQKQYVVLACRNGVVHCYGEVYHAKGLTTRHQAGFKAPREDFTIAEVRFTKKLVKQLLRQYLTGLRADGFDVTLGLTKAGEVTYTATKPTETGISTITIK